MRRKSFGFDEHQILEHRHRHSYWKIELLTPESDIAWANTLVSSIQARAGSQSHVVPVVEVSRGWKRDSVGTFECGASTFVCGERGAIQTGTGRDSLSRKAGRSGLEETRLGLRVKEE
jgi:hypothetical protein